MLPIPRYIELLGLRALPPGFEAGPVVIDQLFDNEVPLVQTRCRKTTERVKLAFGAATVEWIGWALGGTADISDLLQFAEALWAAVVDYRYAQEIPHEQPKSGKPLDYLQFVTWQTANALLLGCREGHGYAEECVRLSLLARHVLPKGAQAAFKNWLTKTLEERVKILWPLAPTVKDPVTRQGVPVPREAFDPEAEFDPNQIKELLTRFLAGLDHNTNRYLRAPVDLKKLGLEGEPYHL